MPQQKEIGPKEVQQAAQRGFKRLQNFRNARLMFLRNYCGQYYDKEKGEVGTEALNLIFNAVRALVPNIVMSFPKHNVTSPWMFTRPYGELLGLTLEQHDKKIDIKSKYRRAIVDAIFTVGCFKTGLAQSQSLYGLDETDNIDAGTVYSEPVDFDNLVVDPKSKQHLFADASFIGDRMCVPRRLLLDSGAYRNDLIERLPRAGDEKTDRAYQMSMRNIDPDENYGLEDEVEVMELWVPGANTIVTVPASEHVSFDDYLRIEDYYGVIEGPYSFLSLTPPVPGNPLPIPMVGIWNDLHILANKMAKKIVDQAMRQKDIVGYKRSAADDAEQLRDAKDGEAVAMDNPEDIQVKSIGGQQNSNEVHLQQLQMWFNTMAGNPDRMAGNVDDAKTATQARQLQGNSLVGLDDMKDLVYQFGAAEARKRAWYFHTDPLIEIPLVRRQSMPAQFVNGVMVAPAQLQDQQVILTPEARRGDFIDFAFNFEPESMGRKDNRTRLEAAMNFAIQVLPAVAASVVQMAQIGVQMSPQKLITRLAKLADIDWMDEVFADPEFQMQMAQMMQMGPQAQNSKGQLAGGPSAPNPSLSGGGIMDQILQNGQPASVPSAMPTQQQQVNSQQQQGIQSRPPQWGGSY